MSKELKVDIKISDFEEVQSIIEQLSCALELACRSKVLDMSRDCQDCDMKEECCPKTIGNCTKMYMNKYADAARHIIEEKKHVDYQNYMYTELVNNMKKYEEKAKSFTKEEALQEIRNIRGEV